MNPKRNCQSCKYYKDGYCKNLELNPCYPQKGCDDFENRGDKEWVSVLDGPPLKDGRYKVLDGKTNGDVIKMMFPNIEIIPNSYTPSVDLSVGGIMMMRVDRNWWNAPYKGDQE